MITHASSDATGTTRQGSRLRWWLVFVNVALVGLQGLSAGFFLSGYDYAAAAHWLVARVLIVGVLVQAVTALVLWRRGVLPAWVAGFSAALLAVMVLQTGLGFTRRLWLHVPVGVGLYGWIARQATRLEKP